MSKHSPDPGALDDLHAVLAFARVVEEGSFTAAARSLAVTTPSISKRIGTLEERLGVRLLERTTRHVRPTDAGTLFYERCVDILGTVESAEQAVMQLGTEARGTLRVSAPVIFGELHVAPLLSEFAEQYPQVDVELSLDDHHVGLVEEGYDIAVRIGRLEDSSLRVRRLTHDPLVVCAAPSYLQRHGTPEHPQDLRNHTCLRYTLMTAEQEWRFEEDDRSELRFVPVHGTLHINHGGAMREAAIAGAGIARLPRFIVAEALRDGRLRTMLEGYGGADREIALVYPAGREPLPKVRAFIDFLAERIPERLA